MRDLSEHTSLLENPGKQPVDVFSHESIRHISKPRATELLDRSVAEPKYIDLGRMETKTDIRSSIGPFQVLPEYKTQYPPVVTQALGNLYDEYNRAFNPLLAANREWDTDYQFCIGPDKNALNRWVQIDMVGLPPEFLQATADMTEEEVRATLRGRIFEIENSLAMYQLLERICENGQPNSAFRRHFRGSLAELKETFNRPVALLAVTDQKYQAMKSSEFGKNPEEPLSDREVREFSGFDKFFDPEDFKEYLAQNGGKCDYLLYARTSDPVAKLKKPETVVSIPLLENDQTRRIIKANAVTFNVDHPHWKPGDPRRINDTKEYLLSMGMGYRLNNIEDGWRVEVGKTPKVIPHQPLRDYLSSQDNIPVDHEQGSSSDLKQASNKGNGGNLPIATIFLNPQFEQYLLSQGMDPDLLKVGQQSLRAKPMQGAYGCYGHITVNMKDSKSRQELKANLAKRGPYVVQPELQIPRIIDPNTGNQYTFIDRLWFCANGSKTRFMSGYRSLMPLNTIEAVKGRNHGSIYTLWTEIGQNNEEK